MITQKQRISTMRFLKINWYLKVYFAHFKNGVQFLDKVETTLGHMACFHFPFVIPGDAFHARPRQARWWLWYKTQVYQPKRKPWRGGNHLPWLHVLWTSPDFLWRGGCDRRREQPQQYHDRQRAHPVRYPSDQLHIHIGSTEWQKQVSLFHEDDSTRQVPGKSTISELKR